MNKRILKGILLLSLMFNAIFLYLLVQEQNKEQIENLSTSSSDTVVTTIQTEIYESGNTYPLMRIVDGDTIVVGFDNRTQYVRLIGIDTPELNDPGGPQCYAEEATTHLQEIAKTGIVTLHFDETQGMHDNYGRLLAYVELPDGTDLGKKMIEDGYAQEYTYKTNFQRKSDYSTTQTEAMLEERGLWSPEVCKE